MSTNPREAAAYVERHAQLPAGPGERFYGYGLMGLPFESGHYLALRRWPANSLGRAYRSVWHRDPAGSWVFYGDTPPEVSCPRYFGSAVSETHLADIGIEWHGPNELTVTVAGVLQWDLTLRGTSATRALTSTGRMMPAKLWRSAVVLRGLGRIAGLTLQGGRIRLTGHAPNGQWFLNNPRLIWVVASSHATVNGIDLGRPGPLAEQARLGDFWLPQRGIFAVGEAYCEQFDAARHLPARPAAARVER